MGKMAESRAASSKLVSPADTRPKPPNAGKGRKKGVPNKATASVKAALQAAFDQRGGVPALLEWAKSDPGEFYKLWAKLLPQEHSGPDGGPIPVAVQVWQFGAKQVQF